MLNDSGTQRAELFTEHLNEHFPGSQTTWAGPPDETDYVFEMRAANKRIIVSERVFELWGGSKSGLRKTLEYYKVDEQIAGCPGGAELRVVPGNGEKPEFNVAEAASTQ